MKKKFGQKIHKILFLSLCGFLFLLWMNSFVDWNLKDITTKLKPNSQEALASENDFQEAYGDSIREDDTLIVVDATAAPGDSFWITIEMVNNIPILGFDFAFYFDSLDTSVIFPDTYTVVVDTGGGLDTTSYPVYQLAERIKYKEWFMVGASFWNKQIDTLRFACAVDIFPPPDPPETPIDSGSGAVVRFKFWVRDYATPNTKIPIRFVTVLPIPNFPDTPPNFTDILGNFLVPMVRHGEFTVADTGLPPPNNCPVFAFIPDTSVNEGTTLEFWVTATDEDNDTIHLSLESFSPPPDPNSYHFVTTTGVGSVTQKFDYTPGYNEGGVTRIATFRATDGECQVIKTVQIEVIETVQDVLVASSEQGGVPGSAERFTPFWITNSVDIYGFQFTFRWDPTKLEVDPDSMVRTDVIEGFSLWHSVDNSEGKATVLVFGLAGETIPAGMDTVVYPVFSVLPDAEPGEVEILLENAREAINPGYPSQPLGMINGKFIIDIFGDANLDQMVDVGDVVTLVAYINGDISFTTRQELAADVNQDTLINVGDLVAMIDIILGTWMGPSPPMYPGPMAFVELNYEDLQPGSPGEVKVMADLEVPVAGAQFEINYDPNEVSFQMPRLSERSDHFIVEYRDNKMGKLTLVLYNFSNDPIPVGEGNILSLPVMVSPSAEEKFNIELREVVLADQKAVLIPVGNETPSVPIAFELNQNYPNPFNPSTTIKFTLPASKDGGASLPTTLKIYNVLGKVVRTLVDEPMASGVHHKIWDGRDDRGNQVASGIYFYRLRAGDFQDTKKMVLMK